MSKPLGPVSVHDWKRWVDAAPPGAIAEFGCYDGGSTRLLAELGRTVYAFDTFDGIPTADYCRSFDAANPPGKFRPTAPVAALFEGYSNVVPIVGRYADTLPQHSDLRFAFAYIDCDLYASYRQVLAWLPQRMLGDCFMCDDYLSCDGAARAVDEWKSQQSEWEFDGQTLFTRRVRG